MTAGRRVADRERTRRRVATLAWLLDSAFRVPGTRFRIGLEPIVGLVPGIGDVLSGVVGGYIVLEAFVAGVPRIVVAQMAANVLLDMTIGAIPLLGDAFDFVYKSNTRNLRLFERYAVDPSQSTRSSWAFFGVIVGAIVLVIVGALLLAVWFVGALIDAL
jgi:hypothetical protein